MSATPSPANTSLKPGLVSVTFREHPAEDVIKLAASAGLRGSEWGGDAHVPHGDLAVAQRVGELTRAAGLEVVAYGSYFRLGNKAAHNGFASLEFLLNDACDQLAHDARTLLKLLDVHPR